MEKENYQVELRRKAEASMESGLAAEVPNEDLQRLIHELQVHQIELELQNEELRNTRDQLEKVCARYSDLYNFAPVGYFTFNREGLIREANLTGAKQLCCERGFLIEKPFSLYVAESDRTAFRLHIRDVFRFREHRICELRLLSKTEGEFHVRLDSLYVDDGSESCRTSSTDISDAKNAQEALKKAHSSLEQQAIKLLRLNLRLEQEIRERERKEEALGKCG